jgi:hypothetical protein
VFDPDAEEAAGKLLDVVGHDTTLGVIDAITSNRHDLVDKLVSGHGDVPGAVAAQVRELADRYVDMGRRAVGASEDEWRAFTTYCDVKASRERADVAKEFIHQSSSKGLKALYAQFQSAGAAGSAHEGGYSDADLESAMTGAGVSVYRSNNGGPLLVRLPHGEMTLRAAIREGFVKVSRQ